MKMDSTCDAYSYADELYKELKPVYRNLETKFDTGLEIFTTFRLLSDTIGRKTTIRFTKKDRILWIDLVVSAEKFDPLKKCEQRHELSKIYQETMKSALAKYRFDGLGADAFLAELDSGLEQIGWKKEEWEVALEALET